MSVIIGMEGHSAHTHTETHITHEDKFINTKGKLLAKLKLQSVRNSLSKNYFL